MLHIRYSRPNVISIQAAIVTRNESRIANLFNVIPNIIPRNPSMIELPTYADPAKK